MSYYIKVEVDDKDLSQFVKRFPRTLARTTDEAVNRSLNSLLRTAKMYAPYETGDLRAGIILGRKYKNQNGTKGLITWRELDSRRRASFSRTKWKDFVTWMHESPAAKVGVFPWKTGYPNFFDKAVQARRRGVIKIVDESVEKAIKKS